MNDGDLAIVERPLDVELPEPWAERDGHWLIDEQYTVLTAYTTGNGG